MSFMRESLNSGVAARGELVIWTHLHLCAGCRSRRTGLISDQALLKRSVNVGFSGGEKKQRDIRWRCLNRKLAILDETDSAIRI